MKKSIYIPVNIEKTITVNIFFNISFQIKKIISKANLNFY